MSLLQEVGLIFEPKISKFLYMKAFFVFCLSLFLSISYNSYSQDELRETNDLEEGGLYWIRYYIEWEIAEKWQIDVEVESRTFFSPSRQYQSIIRSTLFYKKTDKLNFGAGLAYSQVHSIWTPVVQPEIRPHQETNYRHDLGGRWHLNHRLRTEQRFRGDTTRTFITAQEVEEEMEPTFSFNLRVRYELSVDYDIIDKDRKKGHLHAQAIGEIMVRPESEYFDTFRYYTGLRYYLTDNLRLELGFLKHIEREREFDFFYNYNALRFTVRHKL
jgi:hypothetical protein